MDALEGERDERAALGGIGRPVQRDAVDRAQALERVADQLALVVAHVLHADALQEIDRGAQADGLGDVRGTGLELRRALRPARLLDGDRGDHVPAGDEGRHGGQEIGAPVENPDAGRPVRLVAGPAVEVRSQRAEVDRQLRHRLRAVDDDDRAGGVGPARDLLDRVDGPERVGDVHHGDDLDVAAGQQGV